MPAPAEARPTRVLILGGTGEAALLARRLANLSDVYPITSLAGRTRDPRAVAGEVRTGGFGGVDGLADYLAVHAIARVVDATHPFAERMSRHAHDACLHLGVPRLRLLRPAWTPTAGDDWRMVAAVAEAAVALPALGRRAFIATGAKDLGAFADLRDTWCLVRTIDAPVEPIPIANHRLVLGRGPFALDDEIGLLREHRIDVVVCKNSGGEATVAKLAAARRLAVPVVMVMRPPPVAGPIVEDLDSAVRWVAASASDG